MKKLSRTQKDRWAKLSKKRHQKELKRRPHSQLMTSSMRKISQIQKQIEKLRYMQAKRAKQAQPQGTVL